MSTSLSRFARRAVLLPLGFVAFVIVGGAGQLQGQGAGVPSIPVSQDFPRGTDDLVTRILTQGGAVSVLVLVLWFYRRDFFAKIKDLEREIQERRDEKDTLLEVLDRSATAIANSVSATANQTSATHLLTQTVARIEHKMQQRRVADPT